jgi:hypothetical protein
MPPGQVEVPLFISFRTNGGRQNYDVMVRSENPDHAVTTLFMQTVQASPGKYGGVNMVKRVVIPITRAGRYLLDLFIDDV